MNGKKAKKMRRIANAMVAAGWAKPEQKGWLYRQLKAAWHAKPELFKEGNNVPKKS